jgi:mRNA-degrading endonuclease RelE of RelBE toxin-antitoxin system
MTNDVRKVDRGLELIEQSPYYYRGHVVPLSGELAGKYRCRVDPWRIVYTISDGQ